MSDAVKKRQERSSAIARGRFSLVRIAARSGLPRVCGVRYAPTGNADLPIGRLRTTPAGNSTTTRTTTVNPSQQHGALRPAARSLRLPKGATCGVQPRCIAGAARRPWRRADASIPDAPSRGARKAAASSRHALRVRRASVVTTAKLGSDDAVRRRSDNLETRAVRGFSQPGAEERKSAGTCQRAKRRFFRARQKRSTPMFDLVRKAESDARLAGQGAVIVSGYAATLRLL